MNNKYTRAIISYKIGDPQILNRGQYQEAVVRTINSNATGKNQRGLNWKEASPGHFKKGIEELVIVKPMVTIREPEYDEAIIRTVLGESFLTGCLERPSKPRKNARTSEFDIFHKWKTMNNSERLMFNIKKYVSDMGGRDPEIELL